MEGRDSSSIIVMFESQNNPGVEAIWFHTPARSSIVAKGKTAVSQNLNPTNLQSSSTSKRSRGAGLWFRTSRYSHFANPYSLGAPDWSLATFRFLSPSNESILVTRCCRQNCTFSAVRWLRNCVSSCWKGFCRFSHWEAQFELSLVQPKWSSGRRLRTASLA